MVPFLISLVSAGLFGVGLAMALTAWSLDRDGPALPPARAGRMPRVPRRRVVVEGRRLALGLGMAFVAIPSTIGTLLAFMMQVDQATRGLGMAFALFVAAGAFGITLFWSSSR
jgi:hypothetical protein